MSPALPPRTVRPVLRTAGLALTLGLGLAACGSGLQAQTYQERSAADATNVSVGQIAVRDLYVAPPTGETYAPGSDAAVHVVLVNEGSETDRLVSVSSDAAQTVTVGGGTAATGLPVDLPVQTAVSDRVLVLRGLTRELRAGEYVQLTLTFATSGAGTLQVPVKVTNRPGPKATDFHVPETDSNGKPVLEAPPAG